MPTTALNEILATVRQTAAAHASALDELERSFAAETVKFLILGDFFQEVLLHDNPREE
jgi:hypothetical protein